MIVIIFASMRPTAILLFLMILVLPACLEDSACGSSNSERIEVLFLSKEDGTNLTLSLDSIHVKSPSLNLLHGISSSGLDIPLVPNQKEIYVVFRGENMNDSLRLSYETTPKLYAPHCDIEMVYSDLIFIESSFDSLSLSLQTTPPHLEIYF